MRFSKKKLNKKIYNKPTVAIKKMGQEKKLGNELNLQK